MSTKIIAVDFDGCLVTDDYPNIGKTIQSTLDAVLVEQRMGTSIILWTCREDDKLDEAIDWCEKHGIKLSEINENLTDVIEKFGGNTRKIYADEYWDDKAVRISGEAESRPY